MPLQYKRCSCTEVVTPMGEAAHIEISRPITRCVENPSAEEPSPLYPYRLAEPPTREFHKFCSMRGPYQSNL